MGFHTTSCLHVSPGPFFFPSCLYFLDHAPLSTCEEQAGRVWVPDLDLQQGNACPQGSGRRVGRRTKGVTTRQRGVERGCLWPPGDLCDTSTSDYRASAPPSGPVSRHCREGMCWLLTRVCSWLGSFPLPVVQPEGLSPALSCLAGPSLHVGGGGAPRASGPFTGHRSGPSSCPDFGRVWAGLGGVQKGWDWTRLGADLGLHCLFIRLPFHAVIQLNVSLGPQTAGWCWMWV